jgi:Fur family ferric uptake transcriptional regulator
MSPTPTASLKSSIAGNPLEQACKRLKAAGLRLTQPRIAILSVLLERTEPISIEQLHQEIKDRSCDLVTVYRCLAAFEELGMVRRCFVYNGTSLYQMNQNDQPAYHVVGKGSAILETITPVLANELSSVITKIEMDLKRRGYAGVSHMAAFFTATNERTAAHLD